MSKQEIKNYLKAVDFSLSIKVNNKDLNIINGLNFHAGHNKVIGIVGKSGSGKSLFALSLGGLLQDNSEFILSGHLSLASNNGIVDLTSSAIDKLRLYRKDIASSIFQDPYASLNESITCGRQIGDVLKLHSKNDKAEEVKKLLSEVGISDIDRVYNSYPYQLSGGECQRIVICIALVSEPKVIIADEPTSSLDVAIEDGIMKLIIKAREKLNATLILISHDMKLISRYADNIWVMDDGNFIAQGKYEELLYNNDNKNVADLFIDFTKNDTRNLNNVKRGVPLLIVDKVSIAYDHKSGWLSKKQNKTILNNISFNIYSGEIVGLVGASGSGKSSLAKAIVRLIDVNAGKLLYKDIDLSTIPLRSTHPIRNEIQLILQDSYLSFNPAYTVEVALRQTWISRHGGAKGSESAIHKLFGQLDLNVELLKVFPQQLSGGQRQRVMIVRAMIMRPRLLICDESVMALDPYIKKSILDLLLSLVSSDQLTILFISHDLESVRYLCDRVIEI